MVLDVNTLELVKPFRTCLIGRGGDFSLIVDRSLNGGKERLRAVCQLRDSSAHERAKLGVGIRLCFGLLDRGCGGFFLIHGYSHDSMTNFPKTPRNVPRPIAKPPSSIKLRISCSLISLFG
ncbi:hypothetical protein FEP82_05930 [Burkholderia multivorans]|nr:hypothetical protein [Burkholderia multivorans]